MEVVKQLYSNRPDYLQVLRNAPAPIKTNTSGAALVSTGQSVVTQQALVKMVPPTPAAPQLTNLISKPVTPVVSNTNATQLSSKSGWKWLLIFGVLTTGCYLFYRYHKKKEQENK